MSILEILGVSSGGLLVLILSFIKIPKIEINIWGLLGRTVGRALNAEMSKKVDDLSLEVKSINDKLDKHIYDEEERQANAARKRILLFNDEDIRGVYHSKESFDDLMDDIDFYEDYCTTHKTYSNNKATLAIDNIKEIYSIKSKKGSF